MFAITVMSNPAGPMTLALEGNVRAGALPEISRLIRDGKRSRRQVVLDLGEVTLVDPAAVRFLARQIRQGVEMMNCPVYIKHWISQEATHEPQK